MRNFRNRVRNWAIFLPLLLIIILLIGGLTFISGTIGILPGATEIVQTPLVVSPIPTIEGTPIARFGEIDPAIADVIDLIPSNYGNNQLDILSIQSVGIYLPRTGDTEFVLTGPTPLPTPLPFPTSPPLPVPPLSEIPTVIPSVDEEADEVNTRIVPYTAGECAPGGLPVDGVLTQRYHRYHSGVDLGVYLNTPVLATHSGQVIFADWSDIGYGYLVIVRNAEFITYYAHNTSFNVDSGDFIGKGTIVAWSGSTGNSTGPHVHYETRINDIPVDPLTFAVRGYQSC